MIYLLRREFRISAREAFEMPLWEWDVLLDEYDREMRAIESERRKHDG